MWKQRAIAALLLVLPLPATGAVAPGPAPLAARHAGDGPADADDPMAINRELAQFREARVTLCQALVAAEQQRPAARTWHIGFDGAPASPVYRVKTAEGDRVFEYTVDARTGDVTGGETAIRLKDLDPEDRRSVVALRTVRQGLSDAVLVAERATKGKALGGTFRRDKARFEFVIVVLSGDDLKEVLLEPPRRRAGAAPASRSADKSC